MTTVAAAGLSDVGKRRKGNEDSLLLDGELLLYIVADGMGGHRAGEVASRLTVDTVRDCVKRCRNGPSVDDPNEPDAKSSKEGNHLLSSIHLANREVKRLSESKESCRGMGSTVSAVYLAGDTLIAANVGDSPIYLVRDGGIRELSVPHTVLAEQEVLYPGKSHLLGEMYRHMLTRAIGTHETVQPNICELLCLRNDTVVICSDGLSDAVSSDEILKVVSRKNPEKACRVLVDMANARGGEDNVTVVVIKIGKTGEEPGEAGSLSARILAGMRALLSGRF
ncbi:MAG: protein phosphatase 2C domain-containing protein [Syntrophobacteraceae bacterium]|nr:protein phosphatase 2C domain-containing protein [Desulfobacteraceae bacterium]